MIDRLADLLFETDGSRGILAHPSDRAAHEPRRKEASRPDGEHPLRAALHFWLGPILTIGVLLIFIFGIGRHWHG